jgi:ATP-dependent Clp protease protease subunit
MTHRTILYASALIVTSLALSPAISAKEHRGVLTLTDRVVDLQGGVKLSGMRAAQKSLLELDAQSNEPIWLRINSPGGSVGAGLILLDTMRSIDSPVHCVVESRAYSMGAIILTFCEKRYALEHATIMLHEASWGTAGEDPSIRSEFDFVARYLDRLHAEIAKKLKMSMKDYRAKIRDAWWLMADEAKKAGVIDDIVGKIAYIKPTKERTVDKVTRIDKGETQVIPEALQGKDIKKRR